jgi:hypothetical protein
MLAAGVALRMHDLERVMLGVGRDRRRAVTIERAVKGPGG